ncbi:MAG: glycosyltransferase family 4 protein [Planctomycetota bacterium]
MRLLHVLAEKGYSGGEVQLRLLIEHFERHGFANYVLLAPGARFAAVAHELGVPVHEAPLRRWWRPDLWHRIRRAYRAVDPDVVHFACGRSLYLGGLAARGMRAKTFTIRRIDYPVRKGILGGFRYTRLCDHTVAICDAIRQRLLAGGVPDERITVVYDGLDPAPWTRLREQRAAARRRLGIAADAQVISCAGVLRPRKGQHVLLAAFAKLAASHPRAVLFLAGGGSELGRLQRQAVLAGLERRVFLPGPVRPVHDVYAASDLFVMPSFHEGLCNACLEASFAGLPQVVSDAGGNGEIVVDGVTGAVVPKGDVGALADALSRYLADPAMAEVHGLAGRARSLQMFTADRLGPEIEAVVRRLHGCGRT